VPPFASTPGAAIVAPEARVEEGAMVVGPCFVDAAATIKRGARVGPYAVIGRHSTIAEDAVVEGSILWPNTWVETEARLVDTLAGRNCHFGRNVEIRDGLFGDKSVVTDYSQT